MSDCTWRIPYGVADFVKLRRGHEYYVDKTHFLPILEAAGRFLFLIRPRRFGKSLLQSVMECYYDQRWEPHFDELFHDTWIYSHPAPEKHRYLVLRFDFSMVNPDSRYLEQSFEDYIRITLWAFVQRYEACLPLALGREILAETNSATRLSRLFQEMERLSLPLYLFIDEYDNFANTLLVSEGQQRYQILTHGGGFFRYFFALFKGATGQTGGGLSRLFITGVSPITMDDVTSGFNIGLNISLDADFNALLGFTEAEMVTLFGVFGQDYPRYRPILRPWYDQYRFAFDAGDYITNSDMALYFLQHLHRHGKPPRDLIDHNVRIDYGKLRHLIQLGRRLNGNFERLRQVIETGEAVAEVLPSFPVESMAEEAPFVSLLYYLGLLTFAGEREGRPLLVVPNETIRQLMYGYLREAYKAVEIFAPRVWKLEDLLNRLAYRGEWLPFFDYLAEQINEQTGIRDYLQGERMIQGFLLAYLNLSPYYLTHSEREMGKGFVDLFLEPFYVRYPDMRHAYLIELKYLTRGEDSPKQRQSAIAEAEAQLCQYREDARVREALGLATLHALVLVYSGWELVYRAEVPDDTSLG
ncbi:AAA-ATPase-like domain-containing protein [Gammaproteobacteria bacterium]